MGDIPPDQTLNPLQGIPFTRNTILGVPNCSEHLFFVLLTIKRMVTNHDHNNHNTATQNSKLKTVSRSRAKKSSTKRICCQIQSWANLQQSTRACSLHLPFILVSDLYIHDHSYISIYIYTYVYKHHIIYTKCIVLGLLRYCGLYSVYFTYIFEF